MSASLKKIVPKAANKTIQLRRIIRAPVQEEEKLRENLHDEIESKTKACANKVSCFDLIFIGKLTVMIEVLELKYRVVSKIK